MNIAEYIVLRLEELGVNHFFTNNELNDATVSTIINSKPNLSLIGCTSYANAGCAADGYARVRGYGAVVAASETGLLSIINPLASSIADNVPVFCIVELQNVNSDNNYQNLLERFASTYIIVDIDTAKCEADRAIKRIVQDKQPVCMMMSSEIANYDIGEPDNINYDLISDNNLLSEAVKKIYDKIQAAVLPVIVGGDLIKRFNSAIEYKEFVETSGFPVITTESGIGIIDMSYPKFVGNLVDSDNGTINKYINDSDCLISIGCCDLDNINDGIAIYGTHLFIEGTRYDNIKMSDILAELTKSTVTRDIKTDECTIGYKNKSPEVKSLSEEFIYPKIQEFAKENDIFIIENCSIKNCISKLSLPNNVNIEFQSRYPCIGWATPATLGAVLAKQSSRVILLTDANSHLSTMIEVGTMLKYGLKPIILILNNKLSNTNIKLNLSKFTRIFDGDVWPIKACSEDDFDKSLKVCRIMNKMCYIEMFIESETEQNVQQPPAKIEINSSLSKSDNEKNKIDSKNMNNDKTSEELTTICNSLYETTVHQNIVFIDDIKNGK